MSTAGDKKYSSASVNPEFVFKCFNLKNYVIGFLCTALSGDSPTEVVSRYGTIPGDPYFFQFCNRMIPYGKGQANLR